MSSTSDDASTVTLPTRAAPFDRNGIRVALVVRELNLRRTNRIEKPRVR
jgi:hypothetical protein